MALKFQKIKIKEVIKETNDAVSIHFENPDRSVFKYIPGQYLTLKVEIEGKNHNRAYSLSANPFDEDNLIVTIKRMSGGLASNFINTNMRAGMYMDVLPPMGAFTASVYEGNRKHYILIGAGSGITPLMSILKTVLQKEPESKISLVYGNRSLSSVIFKQELEKLSAENSSRLEVIHTLTQAGEEWAGLRGRITKDSIKEILANNVAKHDLQNEFFICGPSAMIEAVSIHLKESGYTKDVVHEEHFTAALSHPMEDEKPREDDGGEIRERMVKIILEGLEKEVMVSASGSILEAGLDNDLDPPYACMIGSCCTCKAKLMSGKVVMDDREGLTDAEINDGFILTCQSHPLTDDVVVNYDEI